MQPTPVGATPLEQALDTLTRAVEAWDPDSGGDVAPLITALHELDARFDPRKDRLSSALCVVSLKLLEELEACGTVRAEAAVGAVRELARGLRVTLGGAAPLTSTAIRRGVQEPVLKLRPSEGGSGLKLSLQGVQDQPLGEMMVKLNMLSREQLEHILRVQSEAADDRKLFGQIAVELGYVSAPMVESALRLQARGRGVPPSPKPSDDPWGDSPL